MKKYNLKKTSKIKGKYGNYLISLSWVQNP